MCTVSIIPLRFASHRGHAPVHGFRLVTNRDENRARTPAVEPTWRTLHAPGEPWRPVRVLSPTDSTAGGTWVAVAESGLVLCLLNGNPRPAPALPPADRLISRGAIVPRLSGATDAAAAVDHVARLELNAFAPFALLAVDLPRNGLDGPRVIRVDWDRKNLRTSEYPSSPVCAVSSGLGDHLVLPRLGLFERMISEQGARPEVQDAFHRHVWPERPEISVMMSRRDARTVSVTTVEVVAAGAAWPARLSMRYQPIRATGERANPIVHRVPIAGAAAAGVRDPVVAGQSAAG